MIQACKETWRQLNDGKPGTRFQERYLRRRQASGGRLRKCCVIVGGGFVVVVGIILLPAPGPGTPVVIAGVALIAQESFAVARLLDRTEVRLRSLIKRGK